MTTTKICNKCSSICDDNTALEKHTTNEHEKKECVKCKESFNGIYDLNKHIAFEHTFPEKNLKKKKF